MSALVSGRVARSTLIQRSIQFLKDSGFQETSGLVITYRKLLQAVLKLEGSGFLQSSCSDSCPRDLGNCVHVLNRLGVAASAAFEIAAKNHAPEACRSIAHLHNLLNTLKAFLSGRSQ